MNGVTDKLAAQVLQKAFDNTQTNQATTQPGEQGSFQQMLESAEASVDVAELLGGPAQNQMLPQGRAQVISAEAIPVEGSPENFSRVEPKGEALLSMLSDFNEQQMHMDQLVNNVLFGEKKFSNQELLAIQAHVFHVAQMTELTVKSVELAVSSFKGVMNTQIQ